LQELKNGTLFTFLAKHYSAETIKLRFARLGGAPTKKYFANIYRIPTKTWTIIAARSFGEEKMHCCAKAWAFQKMPRPKTQFSLVILRK